MSNRGESSSMNELDEDWSKVTDPAEKRRIQIRNAQRRFRKCFSLRCWCEGSCPGIVSMARHQSYATNHDHRFLNAHSSCLPFICPYTFSTEQGTD
jgi:hypothetical protein